MTDRNIFYVVLLPPEKIEVTAVETVAHILNKDTYQVRRLLCGRSPQLIARYPSSDEAATVAKSLTVSGLSAFSCDDNLLQHPPSITFNASSLSLTDHDIEFTNRNGLTKNISLSDVFLILKANKQTVNKVETTTVTRKLSIGKTLLTGFPIFNKEKQQLVTRSSEAELVLRLYARDSEDPVVDLYQHNMDYKFLGPKLDYSSLANFSTMTNNIRNAFPGVYFDERLTQLKNQDESTVENEYEISCRLLYMYYRTFTPFSS